MRSDRYRQFEAARRRAELTVPELWLRYIALGGCGDEFDVEGYLQGLVSLDPHQETVLAVALNERLDEVYRAARIPLPTAPPGPAAGQPLRGVVDDLLRGGRPHPRA